MSVRADLLMSTARLFGGDISKTRLWCQSPEAGDWQSTGIKAALSGEWPA